MTISPYLSAMWWACHGVPPWTCSATHGPVTSTSTSTTIQAKVTAKLACAKRSTIQPTWATVMVTMKILQTSRRSGSCRAARIHCASIGTRITT